ncbi:uncharacterized protein M421DRAFT_287208 [Didymella exigua CBS 183.55]|uniref:Uncharacterized protein n=1 Tax=Didymella exigua CBS 183.55 TaxID=1150837 RepID=A0A6A5RUU3_9PLEO|nr:uncharacterized protein M421DRAFT_287208 [Didymella exigua CBS 183.55]KAF1932235.1 hypothetical protein M421DRAFT_287208 [Didymella exigua CBS 183.55]
MMFSIVDLGMQEVVLGRAFLGISHTPECIPRPFILVVEQCNWIQYWLRIRLICGRLSSIKMRKALTSTLQPCVKIAVMRNGLPLSEGIPLLHHMPWQCSPVCLYGIVRAGCRRYDRGRARRQPMSGIELVIELILLVLINLHGSFFGQTPIG